MYNQRKYSKFGETIRNNDFCSYLWASHAGDNMAGPFKFMDLPFREFIEKASELIFCINMDENFVYVNECWEKNLGYSKKEALLMNLRDIVHPDHLDRYREYVGLAKDEISTDLPKKTSAISIISKTKKILRAEINSLCTVKDCHGNELTMCSLNSRHGLLKGMENPCLTALIKSSDDMIAFKDLDLNIIAANDLYANFLGYDSIKDILGKNISEIFNISKDSTFGKLYFDHERTAQTLKSDDYLLVDDLPDIIPKHKDREIVSKKFPLHNSEGRVLGTGEITRDKTEFRNTLKKLYESKQQFKLLVDQMPHGLAVHEIICDENGGPCDYRFISVNKKFEEQTGLIGKEIIGRTVTEILPKIEKVWIENYGKVALTGEPIQFDNFSSDFNKWYKVSSYSPKHGQFVVVIDDITERKRLEEDLYFEKEQIEKTLLSVLDGVISTDKNGNILLMNRSAENLTGWQLKEALGKKIDEVYDLRDDTTNRKLSAHFEKVFQKGIDINYQDHNLLMSKNGNKFLVEYSAAPISDKQRNVTGMVLVFRDSTEKIQKQKEIEYLSLHDHLTGLYNRRYMHDSIKRLDTKRNLPFSMIYVDLNGLKLINDSLGHEMGDKLIASVANVLKDMLRSDDIVGRMGGDEFVILLPRTNYEDTENIVKRILNKISKTETNSLAPSVAVGWAVKTEEYRDIYDILKNAESAMYRDKLKSGKIMRNTTIENLIRLTENKHASAKHHSQRVMVLCEKIAQAMGLSTREISDLKTTALLHDIGEIVIPASLLNKPEKLSEEEYEQIKIHSEKGYQILRSIDEYAALAESVLQHHERWDGKGYPEGLKERDILLHSRIINVADAYEAMTSDRPYRNAMTPGQATEELKKNKGKQFDPEIVDIFIEKVLSIK